MEQPIHSLDFYGVLIESFMIIFSYKKIFTQITISTILPLSLLSLCHAQFSHLLFPINEEGFKNSTWASFWLFKIVYVVFFLVLSMLSTSAVVHSVAKIYTTKEEVCFGEVIRVVPKIWKRVVVTFAWSFLFVFLYNMVVISLLSPFSGPNTGRVAISGPVFMIYVMGFVYMSMIWHLACVVCVLEEDCGVEAMMKSNGMVRGKMGISVGVFLVLNLCFLLIEGVFERFVVVGEVGWRRVGWGVGCLLFLCGFTLLGLVVQTVVYFVCKMYHFDDVSSNHHKLELGDYVPLRCNELDQC